MYSNNNWLKNLNLQNNNLENRCMTSDFQASKMLSLVFVVESSSDKRN